MMFNEVNLIGRTTSDLELKKTQNDKNYVSFSLAVRNSRNTDNQQTTFVNCIIWGKSAENFQKYVLKGTLINIKGSIDTFMRENNGIKYQATTIRVEEWGFLESASKSKSKDDNTYNYVTEKNVDMNNYNNSNYNQNNYNNNQNMNSNYNQNQSNNGYNSQQNNYGNANNFNNNGYNKQQNNYQGQYNNRNTNSQQNSQNSQFQTNLPIDNNDLPF